MSNLLFRSILCAGTAFFLFACGDSGTSSNDEPGSSVDQSSESNGEGGSSETEGSSDSGLSDEPGVSSESQTTSSSASACANTAPLARIVGYLPYYRTAWIERGDWSKLTHLCLAFFNPDQNGSFSSKFNDEKLSAAIDSAKAHNIKVLASIGGGGDGARDVWATKLTEDGGVAALADSLAALVRRLGIDGVDVDLEYSDSKPAYAAAFDAKYESFVVALRSALGDTALVTAAVANWVGSKFTDGALDQMDFINVMSYDHSGTWTGKGEHSTYAKAMQETNYWALNRGRGASFVVLGLPFYGYYWTTNTAEGENGRGELLAREIAAFWPDHADEDYFTVDEAGFEKTVSWNSLKTIDKKSCFARNFGGAMIWELGQDLDDNSFLHTVAAHRE